MAIAALITWLLTAIGGFVMLGLWINKGGPKSGNSHLPPAVIFGHFALAAIGLIVWIVYVIADIDALAWVGFILLLPVAVLGFVMLARWIPVYRAPATVSGPGATSSNAEPAEKHFPVPVVVGHGVLAVVTVILALLAALGL